MARARAGQPNRGPATRLSRDARRNRVDWDRTASEYEALHRLALDRHGGMAWGLWRVPESKLGLLGRWRGREVLELGCGAGRWAVALARQGARVTGLDLSEARLEQARARASEAGVRVRLLAASAESVPLPDASFDIAFCDWGAMTFADPRRTIPEVARLLRADGIFVFATAHVLRSVCFDREKDATRRRLRLPYFTLHRIVEGEGVSYQLPLSEWIDLFRENGFSLERLVEPRPRVGSRSSYVRRDEVAWSRSWPLEAIWKLRRDSPRSGPEGRGMPRSAPRLAGRPLGTLFKPNEWIK